MLHILIPIWTKELQLPEKYAAVIKKNIKTLSDNMPVSYRAQLGDEFGNQWQAWKCSLSTVSIMSTTNHPVSIMSQKINPAPRWEWTRTEPSEAHLSGLVKNNSSQSAVVIFRATPYKWARSITRNNYYTAHHQMYSRTDTSLSHF